MRDLEGKGIWRMEWVGKRCYILAERLLANGDAQ
jgi:hypothetical protein